jgi:hypothetical protein
MVLIVQLPHRATAKQSADNPTAMRSSERKPKSVINIVVSHKTKGQFKNSEFEFALRNCLGN